MDTQEIVLCNRHRLVKKNGVCSICQQERMEKFAFKHSLNSILFVDKLNSTGKFKISNLNKKGLKTVK